MLYIVSTPIGNLDDISFRAIETLKSVQFVLCEDTRVTHKLLSHYKIDTKTISYHQHSGAFKVNKIIELLKENDLALVSDAGTPGISDPGNRLIEEIVQRLPEVRIVPIPGPSALTTALSISGFPTDKFVFLGFPPHKKGRQKFFKEMAEYKYTTALFESKFRILKTLQDILKNAGDREVTLARELTKIYETIYRGKISDIIEELEQTTPRGEYVIIVKS